MISSLDVPHERPGSDGRLASFSAARYMPLARVRDYLPTLGAWLHGVQLAGVRLAGQAPIVRIPEYKCCEAMIERLDVPPAASASGATENFTRDNAPALFSYQVPRPAAPPAEEGAHSCAGGGG